MKFLCSRAILRLADEEARERISVDAVRGVGPLRMIRRKVNRTAVAAGLGAGASSTGHLCSTECSTEVEGNTVTTTSVSILILVPGLYGTSNRRVFQPVVCAAATTSVLVLSQGALAAAYKSDS